MLRMKIYFQNSYIQNINFLFCGFNTPPNMRVHNISERVFEYSTEKKNSLGSGYATAAPPPSHHNKAYIYICIHTPGILYKDNTVGKYKIYDTIFGHRGYKCSKSTQFLNFHNI